MRQLVKDSNEIYRGPRAGVSNEKLSLNIRSSGIDKEISQLGVEPCYDCAKGIVSL